MSSIKLRSFAACVVAAVFIASAYAQDYPTKPIVIVVPFAAGGPTDTLGRHLGQVLTRSLKQQVLIENTVGAGGTIAVAKVAKARPDGYMILLHHIGMSTAPALYRKLPFNPFTDFEYIGQVADVLQRLLKAEIDKWAPVIKRAGVYAD